MCAILEKKPKQEKIKPEKSEKQEKMKKEENEIKRINKDIEMDNNKYDNISKNSDVEMVEMSPKKEDIHEQSSDSIEAMEIMTNVIIKTKTKKSKSDISSKIKSKTEDSVMTNDFIAFSNKKEEKENNNKQVISNSTILNIKEKTNNLDNIYRSGKNYPWLQEETMRKRGMVKLHYEILDFWDFLKPTSEEDALRDRTVAVLKQLVKDINPSWRVKKFGSFPNKLHLPDSDIDIVILTESKEVDQLKILKKIADRLTPYVSFIRVIEARVPIVRATLKETKINLDIRYNIF